MQYRQAGIVGGKGDGRERFAADLRGLALDRDQNLYAAGDCEVKVFDRAATGPEVALRRRFETGRPGYSVAVAADDTVWVGEAGQVEIFGPEGELRDVWRDDELFGLVTAIGFAGDGVLVADARARWIRHLDRDGNLRNQIGERHRKGGFHIPNGIVDFAVGTDGLVHVANPGMHRVERYTPAGELLGHFGRFDGVDPEGFPGCCNPTNVTVAADRFFVTEKAGPRVKVYDGGGNLLSVVAAGEAFDPGCKNMDLAVDSGGRVYVADTVRLQVVVFAPEEAAA